MERAFRFYVKTFDYILRFLIVYVMFILAIQPHGGIYRETLRTFTYNFDLKTLLGISFFTILGFIGIHFVNTMTYKLLTFQKYVSQISYINLLIRIGLWTYISILVSCLVEILILSIDPTFFS